MGTRRLDPERLGEHVDRLYRAAWALCGSREDAEDLVQETFERVLRKPRFIRRDDDLGYLLRTLRNTHTSRRRTAARRPRETPLPEGREPIDPGRALRPEDAAGNAAVIRAIGELPEDQRDVILAVDVVGLSYREAAAALGAREGTVMSRLFRGRAKLAEMFPDD